MNRVTKMNFNLLHVGEDGRGVFFSKSFVDNNTEEKICCFFLFISTLKTVTEFGHLTLQLILYITEISHY